MFVMLSTYVFKLLQLVTIQFTFIFLKYSFSNKAIFVIFILSITHLFHVIYGIIPTKNKFEHAILMGLYKPGCISFILHNDLFVLTLNIFSYQNEDLSGNLYNSTIKTEIYEKLFEKLYDLCSSFLFIFSETSKQIGKYSKNEVSDRKSEI